MFQFTSSFPRRAIDLLRFSGVKREMKRREGEGEEKYSEYLGGVEKGVERD